MAGRGVYPKRVSYLQSKSRDEGPPTMQIIVIVAFLLLSLLLMVLAGTS